MDTTVLFVGQGAELCSAGMSHWGPVDPLPAGSISSEKGLMLILALEKHEDGGDNSS